MRISGNNNIAGALAVLMIFASGTLLGSWTVFNTPIFHDGVLVKELLEACEEKLPPGEQCYLQVVPEVPFNDR